MKENYFVLRNSKLLVKTDICVSLSLSVLFFKNSFATIYIYLPSIYFIKKEINNSNKIILLFNEENKFESFIKHLFVLYDRLFHFYYIKIKIRGLGYRMREIAENFYYFFFNYTNYYYFHCPHSIIISIYKKRLLALSLNWQCLKLVLAEILLLKSLGPYRLRGLRIPRQFVLLKKSGKLI